MNRDFVTIRINQLPLAIFGIIYDAPFNGIAMPFSRKQITDNQNCEMTLLP